MAFIRSAKIRGHKVFVITMRHDNDVESPIVRQMLAEHVDQIIFTSRNGKRNHVRDQHGLHIDIWIDDQPDYIVF